MKKFTLSWFDQAINLKQEIIAGITNFMAIAYIIILNPIIMNNGGNAFPVSATITATVITIVVMTMFVGFFVKLPFAMAPGMGFNAILTYSLVIQQKLPIPIALGVIFWSSILFLILALSGLQKSIAKSIPHCLQKSLLMGLGCFLIFIGLKNANIIVADTNTLVSLGHVNLNYVATMFALFVTAALFIKKKLYALLAPVIILSILAYCAGITHLPVNLFEAPNFSLFMSIDILGSIKYSLLPVIFSIFLVSYFDATTSTLALVSQIEFDSEDLKQKALSRALLSESIGSIFSSFAGTANGII